MPRELSQQGILVKSNIPTPDEMCTLKKGLKKKNVASEKKIAITEQDSSPSTSSVYLYNIGSKNENSENASSQNTSLLKEAS